MTLSIKVRKTAGFNFKTTVESHGWYDLPPFLYDKDDRVLHYVFQNEAGTRAVAGTIEEHGSNILVKLSSDKVGEEKIVRDVRHILRMDDDIMAFHTAASNEPSMAWVGTLGAGRMLRSPTVFEDVVKTMCTTNCSWALTKVMISNLVQKLGRSAGGGKKAFPTPKAMASVDETFFREEIRAGYRSPYFVELANAVANNALDPERWLVSEAATPDLKKEIKSVKGFGDYATENLLKLLGRYDGLALDSFLRGSFAKKHNRDRVAKDKKIHKHYEKFGEWKGLAIWCDLTEHWYEK